MAPRSRAFLSLCACLRGAVPPHADWSALLALANDTLTTPALIDLVRSQRAAIPDEVARYIEEIYDRNKMRNDRLAAQLEEALLALNGASIVPIMIKGTATLATCAPADRGLRLMSDLDLVVRPDEIDGTIQALAAIGYTIDCQSDRRHTKWYADLKRPQDVGMIDLHDALPGQTFLAETAEQLRSRLRPIWFGAGAALVPSPELQALVLVLHDQFQDHDYWTASIDLRHLLDLKALCVAPPGLVEAEVTTLASGALVRNAFEAQRLLLNRLFGVAWPAGHPKRLLVKLQAWRHLLRARHPAFRALVLPLGLVSLPIYRAQMRAKKSASGSEPRARTRRGWFPKPGNVRYLVSLSKRQRAGKL
jgi:hypothetical protein